MEEREEIVAVSTFKMNMRLPKNRLKTREHI